jgi:hypothetical protein
MIAQNQGLSTSSMAETQSSLDKDKFMLQRRDDEIKI